jgi:hypothetical protein
MIVRRLQVRGVLLLGVAATLVLALTPAVATASRGPVRDRYRDSGSFVDTDLCGFQLHVSYQDVGRLYWWYDAAGHLTRFTKHAVFSEVVRANGKVAFGVDRTNLTNEQEGSYVLTGSWIFFLPDGSHIQNAGRIEYDYDDEVVSQHGPHPIADGRLAELFCRAMR